MNKNLIMINNFGTNLNTLEHYILGETLGMGAFGKVKSIINKRVYN